MQFKPKTEDEIKMDGLAKDGDYDFEVLDAQDQTSKKGNAMIALKLGIYSGDAVRWHVYDYILEAMAHKLRHFCDSVGLLDKYQGGTLSASDCVGRAGKCRLVVQEDKKGQYPPKNSVDDYIQRPAKPLHVTPPQAKAQPGEGDDIPF